MMHSI